MRGGSLEAALAATQGEALRKLTEHLNDAREHFAEIKSHYGAEPSGIPQGAGQGERGGSGDRRRRGRKSPSACEVEYRESERREDMVRQAVAEAKAEFDRVNARSFEYQALKREAEADKNLYEELMRKIKEAGINAGFQNSAIRIADPARPALKPVFPNMPLNVLLAFLFSALVAVGAAVLSDLLDKTVRDPEQVARTLRTEVIGSLPLMKNATRRGWGSGSKRRRRARKDGARDATASAIYRDSANRCGRCAIRFCWRISTGTTGRCW